MGNVVASQNRTYYEGCCTESAIAKSYFLFAQSQTLFCAGGFEEKRHNLHDETLCKAVENDEAQIIEDVLLLEELHENRP